MRRSAALAAAGLVALLLGAASCKPSSLTPFTDWQESESEPVGLNGLWSGTSTAASGVGGTIDFSIASDKIADLTLGHSIGSCGHTFFTVDTTVPIEGQTFELDLTIETQGRLVISGSFTSSTACSGSYHFEGITASTNCPTSDSGSFTATKTQ